jgi:exonuclease III
MRVMIKTNIGRIYYIIIYAPDISKPNEEREIFFEEFRDIVDELSNNEKIFIIGDFKSRIGNNSSIMQ